MRSRLTSATGCVGGYARRSGDINRFALEIQLQSIDRLEDKQMNKQNWIFRSLVIICLALVSLGRADAAESKTAHVVIPFDFWIQDTKLPAGSYEMNHVTSATLVVFTSSDGRRSTEAFLLPVNDDPVTPSEAKLVFLVQNGQHYLYEAWGVYGRRIVSAQYGIDAPKGDARIEVPVLYQ